MITLMSKIGTQNRISHTRNSHWTTAEEVAEQSSRWSNQDTRPVATYERVTGNITLPRVHQFIIRVLGGKGTTETHHNVITQWIKVIDKTQVLKVQHSMTFILINSIRWSPQLTNHQRKKEFRNLIILKVLWKLATMARDKDCMIATEI